MRRDIDERQQRGDLAGAWDDIVVLFRMARHFSEPAGLSQYLYGASMERDAIGQAMEWAVERGQTPERLLVALAAYRDLPKIPPPSDAFRAEANLVENTLDLPASTIRDWLHESMPGPRSQQLLTSALIDGVTYPWERTRARRVNRLVARDVIFDAAREPWQWPRQPRNEDIRALESTPLAKMLLTDRILYDYRNEVGRRALVQVLALRVWQLRHGGQFPDRLDQLVPELLPGLPRDPYSGGPFVYVQSSGQLVAPLRSALFPARDTVLRSAKGSRLLYSVGPDREDHDGQAPNIVFAIPPVEDNGGAGQGPGEKRAAPSSPG